jgi:predicted TIM-barrel fold metal-dependent hydrolase
MKTYWTNMKAKIFLTLSAMIMAGCSTPNRIIDTHIHLYDTSRPEGVPWPPPSDDVLFRPTVARHFDAICEANGVTATVIVEASDRVEDNQWVLDLVKHNPKRYIGLVGNLPIGTSEFAKHLERFVKDKRYVGIRLRSWPEGVTGFNDAVWRDLQLLSDKGLTLDVLMANYDLDDIVLIAKRLPKLKILINHLTGLIINGVPAEETWAKEVQAAAQYPNVYCKVSGIFQRSNRMPAPKDVAYYAPIFEVVYEAFGEDRIIYGSNWPVTDRGGEYGEQLTLIREYFAAKGKRVTEKLFWKNAAKFYGVTIR